MIEPGARKTILGKLAGAIRKRLLHQTPGGAGRYAPFQSSGRPGVARVMRKRLAKMAPPSAPGVAKSLGQK